jgi:cupin 2 domain-containing protein
MKHETGNLFSEIPETIPEEIFETLLQSDFCKLERIISLGQSTPPGEWYDQAWGEWVVLLKGQAGLLFEGKEVMELNPGDYAWIAAHLRHRVEWTSPVEPTVWLVLYVRGKASLEQS